MFQWKKKRKLHHSAAVGAQRQTPARIFGKVTFPKHLQMSTSSFVCGGEKKQPVAALPTELNPPTGSGIGGVCGAHLCQPFTEKGGPQDGADSDRRSGEVAGFPPLWDNWGGGIRKFRKLSAVRTAAA